MPPDILQDLYHSTSEATLQQWEKQSGIGELMKGHYYDTSRLAFTSGFQPPATPDIRRLLAQLDELAGNDPLADVMPVYGLHFTFLPITQQIYSPDRQPDNFSELQSLWQEYEGKTVRISDLRLVALPGQLLLAGIPDKESIAARHQLASSLLASSWQEALRNRHANTPLPAPFWHSTLLRYRAQRLPEAFRQFFIAQRHQRYGSVHGRLKLVLSNYNWTQLRTIR
ncbi:hypothetical protein [Brenneria corticis]|uniref:DUF1868 domain-containing protein n=1 Tax=Brenneria corticis TaxID=2173106 RepID=A0A2U1UDB9_9GAMM|nr:hypothetical protein [Brenneria sp. CFCC 11842]PWC19666.1 hypothetical protein DDT56_01445 [Brenneria sp. CFCC 11842]